ncbi:MAG: B12-binding domain-containing radical SAM protein [candidate division Zixibacteria bacterium]|nr:B12-binding domain-containing radical SAM protein [candidate division Zixibacteria bacterium]
MKKIGLIAMSGVRAHNEELTQLGLTLPGFVDRNRIIASLPSLSLLTLAALTPDNFDLEYKEIADLRQETTLPDDYDLVAISTYSAQVDEAYALADHYRAKKVPVVMGGTHVSALPNEAGRHCTSVLIGEGEPLWPLMLDDFQKGTVKPVYSQTPPGSYDLATAPLPRFDLLDPDKYNRITVQTSRGCPHRCDFCASSILLTDQYKLKPIAKVMAELDAIGQIWDKPFIEFADDNSFVHYDHYKSLLRGMIGRGLRWFTEADINVAKDDELLGLMRDSGCQQVLIGLESPRKDSLDGIELNANWKMKQRDRYLEAIEKIQSYGITVNGCFILGLDGDTQSVFEEVYEFVLESALYEVQITFLTAFPGTPLHDRLTREQRVIKRDAWELCTLFDINFTPKDMTIQELQEGFLWLAKTLYSDDVTKARRRKFRRMLRTSPHFGRKRLTDTEGDGDDD